jgi:hypothetical protein
MCEGKKKEKKIRAQKDRQTDKYIKNARAHGNFAAGKQKDTHD